jgi:hypothetical protein
VASFVVSIFSGYPAELVARWCSVSVDTAVCWKSGTRKPSRQALKLFALHRDGRVLDDPWRDWSVRDGTITDPEGNTTTQGQLRAYAFVMQFAAEVARRSPQDQDAWYELLQRA